MLIWARPQTYCHTVGCVLLLAMAGALPVRADTTESIAGAAAFGNMLQAALVRCNSSVSPQQQAKVAMKTAGLLDQLKALNVTPPSIDDGTCPKEGETPTIEEVVSDFLTLSPDALVAKAKSAAGTPPAPPQDPAQSAPAGSQSDPTLEAKQERLGRGLALSYGIDNCDVPTTPKQRKDVADKLAGLKQQTGTTDDYSPDVIKQLLGFKSEADAKAYCLKVNQNFASMLADLLTDPPPPAAAATPQAAPAAPVDTNAAEDGRRNNQRFGGGLGLQRQIAMCQIELTQAQQQRFAQGLESARAAASFSPDEVSQLTKIVNEKYDAIAKQTPNYCDVIRPTMGSYIDSFAGGLPVDQWAAAAESASDPNLSVVAGWSVDSKGCSATTSYLDHNDGDTVRAVFVGKQPTGIVITLQWGKWHWDAGQMVDATTALDGAAVTPLVRWHSTKGGPFLASVLPPASLDALAKAPKIIVGLPATQGGATTFETTGLDKALATLSACSGD